MKKEKKNFGGIEVILSGFIFGLVVGYFYSERQRVLKKQLSEIQNRINNGFNIDKNNIESDWNVIGSDLRNSYNEVLNEQS